MPIERIVIVNGRIVYIGMSVEDKPAPKPVAKQE